jgi:4'-phosphopantetheinyl transferase EntD
MRVVPVPESWRERALLLEWTDADLSELAAYFNPTELAAAAAHRLDKRRTEWMVGRIAAKILASQRGLTSDPRRVVVDRPHLLVDGAESESFVSLSHSAPFAAAAIDRTPLGIDVQVIRDIAESAAHLFLSDEDSEALQRCALDHRLLHFWCAKEAAFKQLFGAVNTLKRVPLQLEEQTATGLRFATVETFIGEGFIGALTR